MLWDAWSFLAGHLAILDALGALTGVAGIATYLMVPAAAPIFAVLINAFSLLVSNRLGVAILAGGIGIFGGALYGTHRADVACDARVAALVEKSKAEAAQADGTIASDLDSKYAAVIDGLRKQSDTLQKQVDAYAKKNPAVPACQLGADALRLRKPPR